MVDLSLARPRRAPRPGLRRNRPAVASGARAGPGRGLPGGQRALRSDTGPRPPHCGDVRRGGPPDPPQAPGAGHGGPHRRLYRRTLAGAPDGRTRAVPAPAGTDHRRRHGRRGDGSQHAPAARYGMAVGERRRDPVRTARSHTLFRRPPAGAGHRRARRPQPWRPPAMGRRCRLRGVARGAVRAWARRRQRRVRRSTPSATPSRSSASCSAA